MILQSLGFCAGSKGVIKDITDKMGAGMAEYAWNSGLLLIFPVTLRASICNF